MMPTDDAIMARYTEAVEENVRLRAEVAQLKLAVAMLTEEDHRADGIFDGTLLGGVVRKARRLFTRPKEGGSE